MTLLWIPLLSLLGSIISSRTGKLTRNQSTALTLLMPIIALLMTISLAPAIFAGKVIRETITWIPLLGIDIAF
ncbi:hypothetical protein H4J45_07515, partial [Colwellia sp. BRX10-6]|uniref:hypothetical protein n=1 Tax=Colwellia sp. BRX10-6 TaxID=2759841 RepID=UPI0015F571FF